MGLGEAPLRREQAVTITRMARGHFYDDRTCVAPECGALQPVPAGVIELPRQAYSLRAKATALRAAADGLDAEAKRLTREAGKLTPDAWLCEAHHRQLRYDETGRLQTRWLGGLHAAADTDTIEATVAFLAEHPATSPQRPKRDADNPLSSSQQRVAARLARMGQPA
jgi:hypothetical protein